MKNIVRPLIFILVIFSLFSACSKKKDLKSDIRFTQVVKAFSSHLYREYYRYNKRQRYDSKNGQVEHWPINHRVDDPHYAAEKKRKGIKK